jgi:undecaprenyl diphosphate synthase
MGIVAWLRDLRGSPREGLFFGGQITPDRVPIHVAIIMDGNGRWAAQHHLPVLAGHRAGTRALKQAVTSALRAGVCQLTVYSFSTENWSRPPDEVDGLMGLLEEMIDTEVDELLEQGVRLVFIGRLEALSPGLQAKLAESEARTAGNDTLVLYVAFNYGGRSEIIDAVRNALDAGVSPEDLTEDVLAAHLYAPDMAEPDLIIRTSGERRLSNFLLWESAYSELYFSECFWPDFDESEFQRALSDYASRDRRFGAREGQGRA